MSEQVEFSPSKNRHYQVLARKYRPKVFDDLIGQEVTVHILRNAFAMQRVAHAFMLTGVRGVGKTTSARILARALNCTGVDGQGGPTADPCGVCHNCKAILADRHPDVLEIDAASHTGVDDIREIIESSRFRPLQGRMKVFIIDEVHMLSRNAFNALLKTLEEPPAQVTFIFATTELRKVPLTILSRCQRFDLKRVSQERLIAHFASLAQQEGIGIEPDALAMIARAADGSVRDGLSLLDQAIAQGRVEENSSGHEGKIEGKTLVQAQSVSEMLGLVDQVLVFDILEAAFSGRPDQLLTLTEQAYRLGADFSVVLSDLLEVIHLISRLQALPVLKESAELSELERTRGGVLAEKLSVPVLARSWQVVLKGLAEVDLSPDRKAAAEMVLLRLCYLADLPSPAEVIEKMSLRPPSVSEDKTPPHHFASSVLSPADKASEKKNLAPSFTQDLQAKDIPKEETLSSELETLPTKDIQKIVLEQEEKVPDEGKTEEEKKEGPEPSQEMSEGEVPKPSSPPRSWRDVVALTKKKGVGRLHGHLRHDVRLVRLAPPVLEISLDASAPRDIPQKLREILNEETSLVWSVVVSTQQGEPTLAEQERAVEQQIRLEVEENPLVKEIMTVFPGAMIKTVTDHSLDSYGLPQQDEAEVIMDDLADPYIERDEGEEIDEEELFFEENTKTL
ncbi:DNA polymerase III subunit gamma/tau [Entomobacter blattae]|uniref:DNA polymerase III subunit gamma/tau n=1 Tax=Entomobacter blattae TaxID=2762277 RepID=A0A7H1NTJ2_9PROT|nr:DNA polymerase III subunit gamma/tau [Entomobacter blattae]QNT79102.1 Holliday junction ATP-dependent DNA helicase RuvB [Entomobacter blattae]